MQLFSVPSSLRVNGPVVGEHVPRQATHQCGTHERFLDQQRVVAQRAEELAQPIRHSRLPSHALHLLLQSVGRDGRVPELLEREAFLQVRADLLLEDRAGYRFLEGFRCPDLVRVVDAVDSFLGLDPFLERQIAGSRMGCRGRQDTERENCN